MKTNNHTETKETLGMKAIGPCEQCGRTKELLALNTPGSPWKCTSCWQV